MGWAIAPASVLISRTDWQPQASRTDLAGSPRSARSVPAARAQAETRTRRRSDRKRAARHRPAVRMRRQRAAGSECAASEPARARPVSRSRRRSRTRNRYGLAALRQCATADRGHVLVARQAACRKPLFGLIHTGPPGRARPYRSGCNGVHSRSPQSDGTPVTTRARRRR